MPVITWWAMRMTAPPISPSHSHNRVVAQRANDDDSRNCNFDITPPPPPKWTIPSNLPDHPLPTVYEPSSITTRPSTNTFPHKPS
ncbi:hypothetical protein Dda_7380 [Drechslerella dactyloides]|uniref:Uncharacterized protein n=1 Tax=Drechslerella dactyloides TaxID=74499 RepID=A0AAD6ITX9_DREDA|nr:hypothetical protein Dda_7380 [Drechslerella dactyloides]